MPIKAPKFPPERITVAGSLSGEVGVAFPDAFVFGVEGWVRVEGRAALLPAE